MRRCVKCDISKPETDFYKRGDRPSYRSQCKACCKTYANQIDKRNKVSDWRRNAKERLITYHGGACVDCGYSGPPYQMHFDHRAPALKSFQISDYARGWDKLLEESLKCDLVCCMCHNERTHRQRCKGCQYCEK